MNSKPKSKTLHSLGCVFLGLFLQANQTQAAPIVATPGSVSGYTYYPPPNKMPTDSGSNSGNDVSTLQRCLWAPSSGDQTVTVYDDFGSNQSIKLLYRVVGGDGGSGPTGGGGGSSAILLNGVAAVIGNGGDGGSVAQQKSGSISIKAGDVLRFITGGGGGAGVWGGTFSIGGGGGAGYMGGGGGASHQGSNISSAPTAKGLGGGANPGAAGYGSGMWSGTAGAYLAGGVSTFLNGSSAPTDSFSGTTNYSSYTDWNYGWGSYVPPATRWPASGTRQGSPMGDPTNYTWLGGSGGGLGYGGGIAVNTSNTTGAFSTSNYYRHTPNCSYNCDQWYAGADMSKYPPHNSSMNLTRQFVYDNSFGSPWFASGGSFSGQIITMYQAQSCGALR